VVSPAPGDVGLNQILDRVLEDVKEAEKAVMGQGGITADKVMSCRDH
jgi:hypothetical protein